MPTVHDGIGTWYYGKRKIHRRQGTCEFCGGLATLTSYDTTLFFVFFMVPLIPLGRKRILEQCSVCERHRVASLKKWEEGKVTLGAEVLENLREDPTNPEYVKQAIGFAQAYQDEPLFDEVIVPAIADRTDDAGIQAQLGHAYSYFARWPKAEEAYRASLEVRDDEMVREGLALTLLKQGRPREATPLLQHILDKKIKEGAGTIYYLIKGYQAEGLHDEALELMDKRDEVFPDLVELKEYEKQRTTSQRNRGTQKKIRDKYLQEGGKTGYREGGWLASWPRWVAAAIVLGAVGTYLGSALWIGQARKVYLVNGTTKPYSVSIAGQEHTIQPGVATPIRVAEGDVEVKFTDAKLGLEPVRCRIESNFWARPFTSPTFVINPDQVALVAEEEAFYAANNPPPSGPAIVHFGDSSYSLSGLDYEFKAFPPTMQVRGTQALRKTRVVLDPPLAGDDLIKAIQQQVDPKQQPGLCKRILSFDPNNALVLAWLTTMLPQDQALDFLKTRLDERPLLVDWHRMYQSTMESAHPEKDLRPRYEQIVKETNGHTDAIYLLGRIQPDLDKADQLLRQAAAGKPPSGHAMFGLGYRAMSDGKFADALSWCDKALPLVGDQVYFRIFYNDVLFANRSYDRLLEKFEAEAVKPGNQIAAVTQIIQVHAIRGDKDKARESMARALAMLPPDQQPLIKGIYEPQLACWEGDAAGFLKGSVADVGASAILRGKLDSAAVLANQRGREADVMHALIYLAATKSGEKEIAKSSWDALLAKLSKGTREDRLLADVLAGRKTLAEHPYKRMMFDPRTKRVFLAVLAQRHPEQAKEMLALARTLDFHRDPISLCLRKVIDAKEK